MGTVSRTCRNLLALGALLALFTGCNSSPVAQDAGPGVDGGQPDGGAGPSFVVTRPAGGEAIIAGTLQPITWETSGEAALVDIHLVDAGGGSLAIATGLGNTGSHEWQVPLIDLSEDPQNNGYWIRVTAASDGSDGQDAVGVQTHALTEGDAGVEIGSFATFTWDEEDQLEYYYWVDLATGDTEILGTVGDMVQWSPYNVAVDTADELVYVHGQPAEGGYILYTLDATSGELLGDVEIQWDQPPTGLEVNSLGELLAFAWNGSWVGQEEDLLVIDPQTGEATLIGTIPQFPGWNSQTAIDNENDRIFAFVDGAFYALDALSGEYLGKRELTLDGAEFWSFILGLVANSQGDLIFSSWVGDPEQAPDGYQALYRADPLTGEVEEIGVVGDLVAWQGMSAINLTNDLLYIAGAPDGGEQNGLPSLYVMDGLTGDHLYTLPLSEMPSEMVLVY